ncbi:uncharacterized protein FIBRA_07277 [Fibroporia radiculosa]|uniref:GH16 domain-containing protein n=1 Tax=Fibroporia radiculosa TaxID=599839 RepID=J4IBQ5_9APHY|nr:uncharacterized protein FIBRA_07277 [Fibroporia radiculosa]CCM05071.1 predicted protein [Fibroporia radiculosa]
MRTAYPLLSLLFVLIPAVRSQFTIADTYIGQDFFNTWTWQDIDDPTNGRVNYTDQAFARATNLSYATSTKFFMRADDQNVVPSNARGRNSVRILSNKAYSDSLTVLDIQHMPEGCSTWPAFWSLSQTGPWPAGGEIDIIEGESRFHTPRVNMDTSNLISLHTSPNCTVPEERIETGTVDSTNCDADVNYNQGCGVSGPVGSYGAPLNAGGGGWFVMERTRATGIRVWFWPRNATDVPPAVLFAEPFILPDLTWPTPTAYFPMGADCNYETHFNAHQFVFDLTFCGDWAGTDYTTTGCSGSCTDFVDNNPEAFTEAYWEVNSLRMYTILA